MSSQLQFSVQLAETVVLCKDVDVGLLHKALQYLEPLRAKSGRGGSDGAIVEHLAGSGSKLYDEALAVFSKRKAELESQVEHDAFLEKAKQWLLINTNVFLKTPVRNF